MKSTLRSHQEYAISGLKASLARGNSRPMLQLPTGGGKTVIAAKLIEDAVAEGKRCMFTVPAISLIDQTAKRFYDEGIRDIGIIQSNHPMTNYRARVQIASIQTVSRRNLGRLPHVDLVIIDEAHRWFKFYEEWFERWNNVQFIGLTATPWTKGLGKWYDDLVIASTTGDLIESGYLSDFRVFAPSHPDLSKVRTLAGDYHEGDLAEVMGQDRLVSDVTKTWLEKADRRPTLVFAVDRAHARKLQEDFLRKGVRAEYIDAFTKAEDRNVIADKFHSGEVEVVCNVGCLTTGVDWDVRCIVLARPTKSEMLFVQMIGRGLRTADGKKDCLILDHSDTHLRLGFVTDIHHSRLSVAKKIDSTGVKEREERLPKECPSCSYLKPVGVHQCPSCGFAPKKQTDIEHVDGELKELKRVQLRNKHTSVEDKEAFFGMLKTIAYRHRYAMGWAAHKYKERFGVWPNAYKDAPMVEPTPDVLSWIKSRQIAWARSKKRSAA